MRDRLLEAGYPSKRLPTLIGLFGRSRAIEEAAVARALGEGALAELTAAGIVRPEPAGRISSRVRFDVHEGLVLASDSDDVAPQGARVPGLATVSRTLAAVTIRREGETALDLGTGCGIHALLAARHAESVRAVDINPRALAFAEFNAQLNEIENVSLSEGDWLTGVAQDAFDLVTASPAGKPTLESVKAFRESGLADDSDAYALMRSVCSHLVEGGFAHVFCNRLHEGPDGWGPFEELLEDAPCDAVLIVYEPVGPITFVDRQHAVLARQDVAGRATLLDRWRAYYDEHKITRSAWGVVVLRRTGSPGFRKIVERAEAPKEPVGDEVAELFG